mgnify:CR=1 FL=1
MIYLGWAFRCWDQKIGKLKLLFVLIPLFPFFGISCFFNRCYDFKVHGPSDVFFYWFTGPCGCHSHDCAVRVCTWWALLCSSIYSVVTREYISCALSWLIVYPAIAFLQSRRWIDIDSRHVLGPCKRVFCCLHCFIWYLALFHCRSEDKFGINPCPCSLQRRILFFSSMDVHSAHLLTIMSSQPAVFLGSLYRDGACRTH